MELKQLSRTKARLELADEDAEDCDAEVHVVDAELSRDHAIVLVEDRTGPPHHARRRRPAGVLLQNARHYVLEAE